MDLQKFKRLTSDQQECFESALRTCHCDKAGFCSAFNKKMSESDWKWCQSSSEQTKRPFYELQQRTRHNPHKDFLKELVRNNVAEKHYMLYYYSLNKDYNYCEESHAKRWRTNKKITDYIENQNKLDFSLDDISIAVVGHNKKQMDTIQERSYLIKTNLNLLDCGEYSDNKWAEARAFISERDIFPSSAKFIGFITASWNQKYDYGFSIDEFHKWDTASILLNSEPEDKIVLCADMYCPCIWYEHRDNIFTNFFGSNYSNAASIFSKIFGFDLVHKKVPFSNQMIMHRDNYSKFKNFIRDEQILEKVVSFVDETSGYLCNTEEIEYSFNRVHGYIMETISTFWFSYQDFLYIPNAMRKSDWYSIDNIRNRVTNV